MEKLLGRKLKKAEKQLVEWFGNDTNYVCYVNSLGNLAYKHI